MIAKLIAHGGTRDEAIEKLRKALAETEVEGLVTNLPFLRWLVAHPAFRAGETTTDFLTRYAPLSPAPRLPSAPWRAGFRLNLPAPAVTAPPDLEGAAGGSDGGDVPDELTAPMPGKIIRVLVSPGDRVESRATLVVIEAMKMEMPLAAPRAATVRAVCVSEGDVVARGMMLVELEE